MGLRRFFVREGRLRPTWRVACYIVAFLLGRLVVEIATAVLLVLPAMVSLGTMDESELMELVFSLPVLLTVALGSAAFVLCLTYLFRRFFDAGSLLDLGFDRRVGLTQEILGGLLLGAFLIGLIFVLELAAGWIQVRGFTWQTGQLPTSPVLYLVGYAVMMALVAFHEELSFRGYILQNLNAEWAGAIGVGASSVLFGLFHGLNPNASWLAVLNIVLAGLLLAACYLATRQLWLPMAFHFSWDFVQGPVLSLPVSGVATGGLLLIETQGNPLMTGGAFGPEGGLVGTAAMLLGLVLLLAWRRRQRVAGAQD